MERIRAAPDAATLLGRVMLATARSAGCAMTVESWRDRPWASVTYTGSRHTLVLAGTPSPALDTWLAALAEADLPIRGHLVADLAVKGVDRSGDVALIAIEALTLAVE